MDFVDPNWKGFNPPLSPDGVVQAQETAARLVGENIQHIFVSPFLRTIETGHHIAEALGLPLKVEFGVCEWLNPEWFGAFPQFPSLESLLPQFPRLDTDYNSVGYPTCPESWEQCMERCRKTARALLEQTDGNILVIGHGATVEGLARGLSQCTDTISTGLCSLTLLRENSGVYTLELNGDTSHLSDGSLFENRLV